MPKIKIFQKVNFIKVQHKAAIYKDCRQWFIKKKKAVQGAQAG
jgi:hypothetical protein